MRRAGKSTLLLQFQELLKAEDPNVSLVYHGYYIKRKIAGWSDKHLGEIITHPTNGKLLILSCLNLTQQNHFQKSLVHFLVQPLTNSF